MLRLNGRLEVNQVRCLEDVPEEQHLQRLGGSRGRKKGPCDCTIPQGMEGTGQVRGRLSQTALGFKVR